ncbi:MAG: hypothetical protein DMG86_15075 [Acidobacteria bacterium]|nr:MAG: hypothetical protein DMG86_15075 [Acidobacteriota bacterium]
MEKNSQLLQSVKDFLHLQSITPLPASVCERCGASLEYFNAQFWFYGTELECNIPLPICRFCG